MHILFTRFPLESRYGGAEVQTLSLMKGLRERGHQVSFLGSCPTLLEKTREGGIENQEVQIGAPPVTRWGVVSFVWRKKRMKKLLIHKLTAKSPKRKAIIMLSLSEKLLLTDWCIENDMKVLWIEHDRIGRWLTRNLWLPKLRRLSQKVTTVAVSDLSRDLYLELGWKPETVVSIPNGIDVDQFKEVRLKRTTDRRDRNNALKLGCIARLTHDKGVDVLLEAIEGLPGVTLEIVGTGSEEPVLRKQIDRINASTNQRVLLIPSIDDIRDFYARIDALVLPSHEHDPFGLVVAEAMASGVATIVTDMCGIARHLNQNEALIVPAGDVASLRRAIQKMQDQKVRLLLAENVARAVSEKFSLKRMVDRYEELLKK